MAFRLARSVLESHGPEGVPTPGAAGAAAAVRVDQVLLWGGEVPVVIAALERAGLARVRVRPTFACPGDAEALAESRAAAQRLGALVPRAGRGDAAVLHAERFAAPGRLLLCAGRLPACGALGMLAVERDALEVAEVLAGAPFVLEDMRVLGVDLRGALVEGSGGADLALAMLARLRAAGETPDVVEFAGSGLEGLEMSERLAACWLLAEAGMPALFPSDERTRAELRALGRDEDWRRVEAAEDDDGPRWSVDLAALDGLIAPAEDPAQVCAARAPDGPAFERVVLGPGATLGDLATLAALCTGRRVRPGVAVTLVPGSRWLRDAALSAGIVERVTEAGVEVADSVQAVVAGGAGEGLAFGAPLRALREGRGRWHVAGLVTCVAMALEGGVVGRVPAPEAGPGATERAAAVEDWMAAEVVTVEEEARGGAGPARRSAPPSPGPLRGETLAVLGDDVESATLLPSGARVEGLRGKVQALAGQVLAGLSPGFAARARERGGGFLVAGEAFARGEPRAAAFICLAELGVVAVLARSFAPGAAPALVRAGVLPLVLANAVGEVDVRPGDVLELPGPVEGAPGARRLAARNLTRGGHVILSSSLTPREAAVVRAGGSLAFTLRGEQGR